MVLALADTWDFTLHAERRNSALWELVCGGEPCLTYRDQWWTTPNDPQRWGTDKRETLLAHQEHRRALLSGMVSDGYVELAEVQTHAQVPRHDYTVGARMFPGTVLTVDRLYVRKGAADFSSVSFLAKRGLSEEPPTVQGAAAQDFFSTGKAERCAKWNKGGTVRFWCKLHDAEALSFR